MTTHAGPFAPVPGWHRLSRTEALAVAVDLAGEAAVFLYRARDGRGGVVRSPDAVKTRLWKTGRDSIDAAECDRVIVEERWPAWAKLPLAGGS